MNAVIQQSYRTENRAFADYYRASKQYQAEMTRLRGMNSHMFSQEWMLQNIRTEQAHREYDAANTALQTTLKNHARWSVLQWRNCPDDNEIVWAALDSLIEEGKVKAIVDGDIVRYAPAGGAE